MGLDMYAYAIDSRLLDEEWETDCPVYKLARRAVGFLDLSADEQDKLSETDMKTYWAKRNDADKKAKEQGLFDPDFYYWRKFNALHGWMSDLYFAKGGTDQDFNCNTVKITLDDLENLMLAAEKGKLKPTEGFFFGAQVIEPEDIESLFDFAYKAKAAIKEGKTVFYDSWY